MTDLELESYHYDLPEELIAQRPLDLRSGSRLLERKKNGAFFHRLTCDLASCLKPGSLVIVNNSAVFKARLRSSLQSGEDVEFLFLEENPSGIWKALARPRKKILKQGSFELREGTRVSFKPYPDDSENRFLACHFDFGDSYQNLFDYLAKHGEAPIPPYIRQGQADQDDFDRYQTIYSQAQGSVAAPTAGLHFDGTLLDSLTSKQIQLEAVTLHVGVGTFLPVSAENITQHLMHVERYCLSQKTFSAILAAKEEGRDIILVGTTTLRVLESFAKSFIYPGLFSTEVLDTFHETSLYIYPGCDKGGEGLYKPWACSALFTNFHQPKSSLIMLVSALIGRGNTLNAYGLAIKEKYRFLSYGDACLFWL